MSEDSSLTEVTEHMLNESIWGYNTSVTHKASALSYLPSHTTKPSVGCAIVPKQCKRPILFIENFTFKTIFSNNFHFWEEVVFMQFTLVM